MTTSLAAARADDKPNIMFILADDAGIGDCSACRVQILSPLLEFVRLVPVLFGNPGASVAEAEACECRSLIRMRGDIVSRHFQNPWDWGSISNHRDGTSDVGCVFLLGVDANVREKRGGQVIG